MTTRLRISGNVRMTAEAIRDGHNWGLAIVKHTGISAHSVYGILRRLRDAGWVTFEVEPTAVAAADRRSPRTQYTLTSKAIDALGWHDL